MKLKHAYLPLFSLCAGLALAASPVPSGLDRSGFDAAIRPQDDLFLATNGKWLQDTPIPPDKADYGVFSRLRDQSDAQVRDLVEALAAQAPAVGSEAWKVATYYRTYLDEAALDKAGLAPLTPWLADIDGLHDKQALAVLLGRFQGRFATPLVTSVGPDEKDPGRNRALAWQGGLGLPDRDYYLKEDSRYAQARTAYQGYLETLFRLAGATAPAPEAQAVMALEKRLAAVQWSRAENRDPLKTYNPMTLAALSQLAPGVDWGAFFTAAALPKVETITISQPSYAAALAKVLDDTPLATWQSYLRARVLDGSAGLLPKPFREARFAFRGRTLQGLKEEPPRWQKAVAAVNDAMGEAVGRRYVALHFPPTHRARAQALVDNLLRAYAQSIETLSWMTPATRVQAREKLAKYVVKIGYPDTWRDYSGLEVRAGDALGNDLRAGRFEYERVAARVGKPVDRSEWHMTPQTVNAYYNPSVNEIVFPAAILQAPFFDPAADDALNYGAIGAVIGHEISHGFDDKGSQFDGDGRLRNWWTGEDRKAFNALADKVVAQYARYEPLPGRPLNGQLTLGENIADISGLQIAYKAYHLALGGKPAPVIDGVTGDQRFFYGWAQSWRAKRRDERALQLLSIDPHSPPAFRANGAAVNHDGFHAAFGTQPGDALFKPADERIRLW